eukprot:4862463-Pyramimonas_sp.AAC.1
MGNIQTKYFFLRSSTRARSRFLLATYSLAFCAASFDALSTCIAEGRRTVREGIAGCYHELPLHTFPRFRAGVKQVEV